MKIGTRLIVSLAIPIAILVALFGLVEERSGRARFDEELSHEGRAIARTVQLATQYALRDRQLGDVHTLIEQMSGGERVLGVRLFDRHGRLSYQPALLASLPPASSAQLHEALERRQLVQTRLRVGREPVVSFLAPLPDDTGGLHGAVQVLVFGTFSRQAARESRRSILTFAVALFVTIGVTLLIATRVHVSQPIEALVDNMRHVASGDLAARVPVLRRDEIGRLASEFNTMCERLAHARLSVLEQQEERRQIETRMREMDRLASLGRLAAGLAHEIGTPLNVIRGRAEWLLRRGAGAGGAGDKYLRTIADQIDRIAGIVRNMLDFAREREPQLAPTRLTGVIEGVIELIGHRLEEAGIRLETELPEDLPGLSADAHQLHEVFLNLALNAVDAMPHGGTLRICVACVEVAHPEWGEGAQPYLVAAIEDTGTGIPAEHLGRVFDPFFTTKDVGEGTGLGLSIAHGIVREHGGWIEIESAPGHGTRVTVHLPFDHAAMAVPLGEERIAT